MTQTASVGTCYGFAIRSDLPFRFLRGGDGEDLDVFVSRAAMSGSPGQLLQDWNSEEPPGHDIHVYGDGALYRLWSSHLGWFTIDPRVPSIGVPDTELDIGREQMTLTTAALLCFHARGDVPLHAAAVEVAGEAILFAAPGTFGKTTLAAGFWRAGHRILSEDLVRLRPAPAPAVIAGPAMIRLRRDVAERISLPEASVIVETPTRVCFALDGARSGTCDPVPLRAVVIPMASTDPEPQLERVDASAALRDLWALCALFPTEDDYARRFSAVADIVNMVPVYKLHRAVRFEELDRTVEWIVAHV